MSKIRFAFALAFATICILLLLAGCEREQPGAQTAALPPQANTVQEAAAQWAAEQEAAEEPAAEQLTWEEVYAALLRELEQVTDLTWRQAYAALLRELATVINFTQWGWDFFGDFFLHDIDGTGTPNLIVFRPVTASGGVLTHSAYAFEGGVLSPIELGDMPHHLLSLYVPPGDTGIVAYNFFHEGPTLHDWLELEDGIFRRRVSGRSEWLPEVEVEGVWDGQWRMFYQIDGQEVSEDEFWSVFPRWGEMNDGVQRMWRMTEENIQNVVLGEAWRQAYADLLRELATVPDQWGMSPSRDFHLIDIDGTGTPNLIVIEHWAGGEAVIHSAYAFEGGVLSQIELGDMPRSLSMLYMPPGDTGIVAVNSFHEGPTLHDWLELEDGIFRRRVSGRSEWLPEVEGVWDGPWRTVRTIDGQEVSEDEFFSVFRRWGEMNDGVQRMWRLTEENIQNVVLGG